MKGGRPPSYKYEPGKQVPRELLCRSNLLKPDTMAQVYRLDTNTIVKTGDGVRLAEAAAIAFIKERHLYLYLRYWMLMLMKSLAMRLL